MTCLPKPLPSRPAARRGFVGALLVSLVAFIAADAYAQVGGSGYTIMRVLDGTTIVNPGDTANSAVRVNVVAGSAAGVSHVDDAPFTVATDDIVPMGAMFDDVSPDTVNEGDAGVSRMSANRVLYGTIRDAAGNERGANVNASGQLEVSAAVASIAAGDNNIGNVDIASAIPAGDNNIGNIDVLTFPSAPTANNAGAQVSVTTTSATVLASFATRKGCGIVASPNNSDVVHLKLGATATTANGKLWPGEPWNCGPVPYTGVIDARSAAGTQEVTVWEW